MTMDLGDLNLSDGNVQICSAAERCFVKIRTALTTQVTPPPLIPYPPTPPPSVQKHVTLGSTVYTHAKLNPLLI